MCHSQGVCEDGTWDLFLGSMAYNKREYNRQRKHTPMGRADNLLQSYNRKDKKYNRGKGDLTAQWIVDNIFTKPCAHCGKEGWDVIGCNRIDESKPHTMDNVEPCCKECNDKIHIDDLRKQVDQIDMTTGEVIASHPSSNQAAKKLGFVHSNISRCCSGLQTQHKGYIWKRPL